MTKQEESILVYINKGLVVEFTAARLLSINQGSLSGQLDYVQMGESGETRPNAMG
jgi:hypothetical protein